MKVRSNLLMLFIIYLFYFFIDYANLSTCSEGLYILYTYVQNTNKNNNKLLLVVVNSRIYKFGKFRVKAQCNCFNWLFGKCYLIKIQVLNEHTF